MTIPFAFQLPDAAAYVGVSQDTLRAAIRAGLLPARKIGTRWSVRRDDLEAWHGTHKTAEELDDKSPAA